MDHTEQIGTAPILKLIMKFSLPAIISMTVNALYNIIDRIFVGQFVGEEALGGLTIAFPVTMVTFAIGALTAIGGATLISIKLGERKHDEAEQIFGNLIVITLINSLILTVAGEFFLDPVLKLVGATAGNLPYAKEFMQLILPGLVFQMSAFALAALARSEGKPLLSMMSQLSSAVINIIMDAILICGLGMGVKGAAISTIVGQFIGLIVLVYYFFFSKKSFLKFRPAYLKLKASIIRRIFVIGTPNFIINFGQSTYSIFMIAGLSAYGGDPAITSMGAINSLVTLVMMPIFGMLQGVLPIMGYNFGMRQISRVRKTLWQGIGIATVFSVIMLCLMETIPEIMSSLFLNPNSPTMEVCAAGLRLQAIAMPILPLNILAVAYFQATTQGTKGMALTITRQAVLIALVIALPYILQLNGSWLSSPFGEVLSAILVIIMLATDKLSKRRNIAESVSA